MPVDVLFATRIDRRRLIGESAVCRQLAGECLAIAADDVAGQKWCREHRYAGYTSYASLNDLAWRSSSFADLQKRIERAGKSFARHLGYDLAGRQLVCDSLWINILDPGGHHSAHLHPHSVLSGTVYVQVPRGSGALRFEDPRLPMQMNTPQRLPNARRDQLPFITIDPKAGELLLWESWLRHEVLPGSAKDRRISVSFNLGTR